MRKGTCHLSKYISFIHSFLYLIFKFFLKSFNTKSGVYNHKLHVHRIGYDAEKLKRKFPICDKVLANQASLSGCMKTHEGLRPHKCTECNQVKDLVYFSTADDLVV